MRTYNSPTKRNPGQIRLHISPQRGGALTRWRFTGSLVTAIPSKELRHVLGKLSLWSGSPIELVLPAGEAPDPWRDSWEDVIERSPELHLEVRFEFPKFRRTHDRNT